MLEGGKMEGKKKVNSAIYCCMTYFFWNRLKITEHRIFLLNNILMVAIVWNQAKVKLG